MHLDASNNEIRTGYETLSMLQQLDDAILDGNPLEDPNVSYTSGSSFIQVSPYQFKRQWINKKAPQADASSQNISCDKEPSQSEVQLAQTSKFNKQTCAVPKNEQSSTLGAPD